jgi:hypothetical protein
LGGRKQEAASAHGLDIANYRIKIAQDGFFVKVIFSARKMVQKISKKFTLDFFPIKRYIDVATSSDTA